DPEQREADDGELGVPVRPRRRGREEVRRAREALERELVERVRATLEVDHAQAVGEGSSRAVVGDAAGDLVEGEEAEPDGDLEPEVAPSTRQVTLAHVRDRVHRPRLRSPSTAEV